MAIFASLLLALLGTSCVRTQLSPEWNQFRSFLERYEKVYRNDSATVQRRFEVFKESLWRHEWLNSYEAKHGGTARYGINKFSDLTPAEFKERYLSGLKGGKGEGGGRGVVLQHSKNPPPTKFDWREYNAIGPVRNQERCGSCWAFAVVETVTSRYSNQSGHLVQLSPQQLISCDNTVGLDGCHGGIMEVAFRSIATSSTVVVKESAYPFESGDGNSHPCKANLPNVGLKLKGYVYVQNQRNYNETVMLNWLTTFSPLTNSVNANAWQDYVGGIVQHHCSGGFIDHAVQSVGYDLTGPVQFWIVRNTWGTDWGEDGYIRLKFGANMCGLTDEVAYVNNVEGVNL